MSSWINPSFSFSFSKSISSISDSSTNYSSNITDLIHDILLKTDFHNHSILDILSFQNNITQYTINYINVTSMIIDKSLLLNILHFLLNSSIYLNSNFLKTSPLFHSNFKLSIDHNIPRFSYKLCKLKNLCKYKYNKKSKKCFSDHFVHHMLIGDIDVLIKYILLFEFDSIKINNEIVKSLYTFNFIFNNMYSEFSAICLYTPTHKQKFFFYF